VFSFVIQDDSGSIRVTCWRDAVQYEPRVMAGKQLVINGVLSIKSKRFSRLACSTTSDYEIHIDSFDDTPGRGVGGLAWNAHSSLDTNDRYLRKPLADHFTRSNDLSSHLNRSVDVCGVVSVV
jgi:hypothetical protein